MSVAESRNIMRRMSNATAGAAATMGILSGATGSVIHVRHEVPLTTNNTQLHREIGRLQNRDALLPLSCWGS